MIKHKDGTITDLPVIKTHPKMQNGMLTATELSNNDREQMIQVLSNYIDDDEKNSNTNTEE